MQTFIMVFALFIIVVLAMAVGYIVQRKTISGSCGGIGALGMEKPVTVMNHAISEKIE